MKGPGFNPSIAKQIKIKKGRANQPLNIGKAGRFTPSVS
jgi:hypothetical protein